MSDKSTIENNNNTLINIENKLVNVNDMLSNLPSISGGDATSEDIVYGKTALVNNNMITGVLEVVESPILSITDKQQIHTAGTGLWRGVITSVDDANLVPENIKEGVSILRCNWRTIWQ